MSVAARFVSLSMLATASCASAQRAEPTAVASLEAHAMRLRPGQDLRVELERWAKDQRVTAACIITAVGSLTRVPIRYANREQATLLEGHFEVTSLVGTLSEARSHLHITVADGEGRTGRGGRTADTSRRAARSTRRWSSWWDGCREWCSRASSIRCTATTSSW